MSSQRLNFKVNFILKINLINFRHILDHYKLRIIVNANPLGRKKVEKGNYCFRSNLNRVDINRNWDYNWGKDIALKEEYPGAKAFSEIETQFTLAVLKSFKAHIFLTVHSGIFAVFHPYAYDREDPVTNAQNLKSVVKNIQNKFCSSCLAGSASKLIRYKSSGTSLDYAYSVLKIPYSFAWEIFTDETSFPEMQRALGEQTEIFLQKSNGNSSNFSRYLKYMSTSEQHVHSDDENEDCYNLFNPKTKKHYNFVVSHWTKVSFII